MGRVLVPALQGVTFDVKKVSLLQSSARKLDWPFIVRVSVSGRCHNPRIRCARFQLDVEH